MSDAAPRVFWHDDCLLHDPGTGLWESTPAPSWLDVPEPHPESADRLRTLRSVLTAGPIAPLISWRSGRAATDTELSRVHTDRYLELLAGSGENGRTVLEPNTTMAPGSWRAVRVAAGTSAEATEDALALGGFAYALIRPPGHHAQSGAADGYCLVNNAAVAVETARARGRSRIAVIDWDAHHGNGTQEIFYADPDVLTVSLHMRHGSWGPSHPQTGAPDELGIGAGRGRNINIELTLGSGDDAIRRALNEIVTPVLAEFQPDFLVCASGFDAATFDPNARLNVTAAGFRDIGAWVRRTAARWTSGAAVFTQEGAYLRGYAAICLHALFEGLLDGPSLADPLAYLPDDIAGNPLITEADLAAVRAAVGPYWTCW